MSNNYSKFDNTELNYRNDAQIQERVGLVSAHMYKQFLDYQNSTVNTSEIFNESIIGLKTIVDNLQKSFSSRGVPSQNIYIDYDSQKTVINLQILWHTISFTTRCNFMPQALYRLDKPPLFCGRIMAINGKYSDLISYSDDKKEIMKKLLDNEIASLYVPSDKMQHCVFKIRHLQDREFYLNTQDCAKEFILKVIEIVCGGGLYHEEVNTDNLFNS